VGNSVSVVLSVGSSSDHSGNRCPGGLGKRIPEEAPVRWLLIAASSLTVVLLLVLVFRPNPF